MGSTSVRFRLLAAAGHLSARASTATYVAALPHVKVSYAVSANEVQENVVLASKAAPHKYVFHLDGTAGVSLRKTGTQIGIVKGNRRVGILPAPSMRDAHGVAGHVAETLTGREATGWTLTYIASPSWLSNPRRAYPVTIDPTFEKQVPFDLCEITNYTPNLNNCDNPDTGLAVGAAYQGGSTLYKQRELVGVSLPTDIPYDALIIEANLAAQDADSTEVIQAAPIAQTWTESATWNDAASGTAWTTAGGSTVSGYTANGYTTNGQTVGSVSPHEYAWYVTGAVQDWLTNKSNPGTGNPGIPNNGFLLQSTSEGTNQLVTVDPPKLNIEWQQRAGDDPGLKYQNTALDDKTNFGLEPANGNGELKTQLLNIPGVGENLGVDSYYNSWSGLWTLNAGADVNAQTLGDGSIVVSDGTSATTSFTEQTSAQATCQIGATGYITYQSPPADTNQCAHGIGSGSTSTIFVSDPDSGSYDTFGGTANAYIAGGPSEGDPDDLLLTGVTDRNGEKITYTYNSSNQLTSITDTEGHVFTVTPSTTDTAEPASIAGPVGATGSNYRTWSLSWATNGDLNSYTDPTTATTDYYYDANSYLDEVLAPGTTAGATESTFVTGTKGEIHSFSQDDATCPSGVCTTTFNSVQAAQPAPAGGNTCTSYAGAGYTETGPTTMVGCSYLTDPLGNVTNYGWNTSDGIVKTIDAQDNVTAAAFDPTSNQQTSSTDGLGNVSLSTFNSNLDQVSSSAPKSATGQTAALTDLAYNTSGTSTQNGANLPSSSVDPNNKCTAMGYDTNGNMTSMWAGLTGTGSGTSRLCSAPTGTPPTGSSHTVKTYKGDTGTSGCTALTGELCSTTSPNGNVTTDSYNSLGQLTTVTPPTPAQPTTYTYDPNGRVHTVTDGAGRTTTYTYDGDDRVTTANYNAAADPTCATASDCVVYTFDPNGNELAQTDGTGTTSFAHNARNQTTAETLPGAATRTCGTNTDTAIHYTRDADGNLTSYCDAGGTVAYTYNALNQLPPLRPTLPGPSPRSGKTPVL